MKVDYPITFLYYRDLDEVTAFYNQTLGLTLARDQGWCKIFRISPGAYVGLVDEQKGSVRATKDKAVLLTLVVDDVDAWHQHLSSHLVADLTDPKMHQDIGVYGFFFSDPGGYMIEIQKFTVDLE